MIYFDSAATSLLKPLSVGEAVLSAMQSFGGPGRGSHPASLDASRCVYQARKAVADLFGCVPERTVFTSNGTESLNIAINGVLSHEDHVITTVLEHNSVLRPLYRLRDKGMGLSAVEMTTDGSLNYDSFKDCLRKNTKAVVCTHASNLTGYVTDIDFISDFCKKNGLLLIVDASQTAGLLPINLEQMGIDILCFTGHKGLYGPQGTGGLCIGEDVDISPLKVGGSGIFSYSEKHPDKLPESLEAGTLNAHGIAGLLAGVKYISGTGQESIRKKGLELAGQFIDGISKIPEVRIYRRETDEYVPIVLINIGSAPSGEVGDRLAYDYDICVRTGAHCAPLAHISLGTREQGAIRFSFSSFNTSEEIKEGIKAVSEIAADYRR